MALDATLAEGAPHKAFDIPQALQGAKNGPFGVALSAAVLLVSIASLLLILLGEAISSLVNTPLLGQVPLRGISRFALTDELLFEDLPALRTIMCDVRHKIWNDALSGFHS